MTAFAAHDAARVAEIGAELATLRVGQRCAIDDVLPAVRDLMDVENMLAYALVDRVEGWQFERWHHHGSAGLVRAPLAKLFASATNRVVFYDPRCPDVRGRNRVIEATAWIDRDVPGTWLESQLCREVFVPLGMQHHKQLRVLVCDGVELLGWFGTLTPGPITRRQVRLLSALAPAMRRRLAIERRLAAAPRTVRALEVALDRIGAPAFVVTARGAICEANAAARRLIERDRRALAAAIEAARTGRPHPLCIEMTSIAANGVPDASLAIVRSDTPDARTTHAVAAAAARWSLTPRQRDVLAHIARGDANATIAAHLSVSVRAVELHVTALLDRAGVPNRAALVAAVLAIELA